MIFIVFFCSKFLFDFAKFLGRSADFLVVFSHLQVYYFKQLIYNRTILTIIVYHVFDFPLSTRGRKCFNVRDNYVG